jgi:hypothetical protein
MPTPSLIQIVKIRLLTRIIKSLPYQTLHFGSLWEIYDPTGMLYFVPQSE